MNTGDTGDKASANKPKSSRRKPPRPADQPHDAHPTPRPPRNLVASIAARLLNLAHAQNEEFQLVLMRYGLERLLYRLGRSPYAGQFVVKGALLFTVWAVQSEQHSDGAPSSARSPDTNLPRPHRATRDLDLLGYGSADLAQLERMFRDLCQLALDTDDGLAFLADTVQATPIREDQVYGGMRLHLLALLGKARIPLQVDVGFGDVVTPTPAQIAFPTLLSDLPAPQVRIYPRETVIAEKFEALVRLGLLNTRMKDFYDLWMLANQFPFDGNVLGAALQATFARRGTALPRVEQDEPVALTARFGDDRTKQLQWTAFLRKGRLATDATPDLPGIVAALRTFLLPPVGALLHGHAFDAHWDPGGPWIR